jgi:hypothetical protein
VIRDDPDEVVLQFFRTFFVGRTAIQQDLDET